MSALLPPSSTALHRAAVGAMAGAVALPIPIRDLKAWDRIPDALLPYLAWELSVDLWEDDWPIAMKRDVVRRAVEMHRLKGTLEGIRQHVRLAGGEVVAARVPPDGFYPDPAMTKEEREAFLSRFRQIRTYPFRANGMAQFGAFLGRGYGLAGLFAGKFYPTAMGAEARLGMRATLFDPLTGVEIDVRRAVRTKVDRAGVATEFEEIRLPGKASAFLFAGGPPRARVFVADRGVDGRVYRLGIDRAFTETSDRLHVAAITPAEEPIDVRPTRVARRGTRKFGSLFGRLGGLGTEFIAPRRVFLPPSRAPLELYDVVYLHDRKRAVLRRRGRAFAGHVRLGMPPFEAELRVRVPGKRPRRQFGRFLTGFVVDRENARVDRAREAIVLSKAARDKVMMTTRTKRPVRVGDAPRVGSVRVGDWTDAR